MHLIYEAPMCACGCGELVKWSMQNKCWNKYIFGHQNKGKTCVGKPCSEDVKKKISDANKGRKFTDEHRQKLSDAHKGVPLSETHRINSGLGHIGLKKSEESKNKIAESLRGRKHTKKTREKISKVLQDPELQLRRTIGMVTKNGLLDNGYCDAWEDKEYRNDLRGPCCEVCGITNMLSIHIFGMQLHTHHKNGKKACSPNDIQTLCSRCHTMTHHMLRRHNC